MSGSMRLRRLGARESQYLLLVVAEVAWIYPWSLTTHSWIFHGSGLILDLQSLVAILLLAALSARLSGAAARWIASGGTGASRALAVRVVLGLTIALGLALMIRLGLTRLPTSDTSPGDIGTVLRQLFDSATGVEAWQLAGLVGFLWWRGLGIGRAAPGLSTASDHFVVGLVAMTVLLVMAPLATQVFPMSTEPLMISALVFLCSGLTGLSLARLAEVSRQSAGAGEQGVTAGGCWLVMLIGALVAVVLLALTLAQIVSFDRIDVLWTAVRTPVLEFASVALYVLSRPFELMARVIAFLLSLLPSSNRPRSANSNPMPNESEQPGQVPVPPEAILALKVLLVLVVAALLIWLLVRALSRLGGRAEREEIEETHDSVWSWPSLNTILRGLVAVCRLLLGQLLALLPGRPGRRQGGSVREIYSDFLALGADLGQGRRASETPLEYEQRLSLGVAAGAEEVRSLTEAYNRDRYAPRGAAPPDAGLLMAALERLRMLWTGRG